MTTESRLLRVRDTLSEAIDACTSSRDLPALSPGNLPDTTLEGCIVDSLPIPPSMYNADKWLEWLPGTPA